MKHHILILHTDAQMYRWLGIAGNSEIRTPNLDQLARSGTYFPNAQACSGVCVPSRASLMTGRYPVAHGVTNNSRQLPATEKTMGQFFAEAGYATAIYGKTSFAVPGAGLGAHGWQDVFGKDEYNQYLTDQGIALRYPEKKLPHSAARYWNLGKSAIPEEHYFEKVLTDRAMEFITQKRDNPFLCMVSWVAPHGPFTPPGRFAEMYDPAQLSLAPRSEDELRNRPTAFVQWVEQNQKYVNDAELRHFLAMVYGMVSLIDEQVGRLIECLRAANLWDETLVVFASDHGDYGTGNGIFGKSWNMIDPLIRIPLILRAPTHRAKSTFEGLVENIDILPTLLDYAGIPVPGALQGKSLWPLLNGENYAAKPACFASNSYESSRQKLAMATIRTLQWRFIAGEDGTDQLFDVIRDPWNLHNVAAKHPDVVRQLKDQLLCWQIGAAGTSYNHETASYWEDETLFWDETQFTGERIASRGEKVAF